MALTFQCAGVSPIPSRYNCGDSAGSLCGDVGVGDTSNYSFGVGALQTTITKSSNRAFGFNAGNRLTSVNNCVIGANAMSSGDGNNNVAIGAQAMQVTSRCSNNTVVGYKACATASNSSNNVAIGTNASFGSNSSNVVVIGSVSVSDLSDAVVIGSSVAPQHLFCKGIGVGASAIVAEQWYAVPTTDKPIAGSGEWFHPSYVVHDLKISTQV